MNFITKLSICAGLAALAVGAASGSAQAQYHGGHHDRGWNGPQGHFIVVAEACPDLREDYRDRRGAYGRHRGRGYGHHNRRGARHDWRDRRVLDCPPRAWRYVPSRYERRIGRTGERLRPDLAFYDRRTGRYEVETRWGDVPVEVIWDRRSHRFHDSGFRISLDLF